MLLPSYYLSGMVPYYLGTSVVVVMPYLRGGLVPATTHQRGMVRPTCGLSLPTTACW